MTTPPTSAARAEPAPLPMLRHMATDPNLECAYITGADLRTLLSLYDERGAGVPHDCTWEGKSAGEWWAINLGHEGLADERKRLIDALNLNITHLHDRLAIGQRNEALLAERYDFWMGIAKGAAEELGLPPDGMATDLRPAIAALRAQPSTPSEPPTREPVAWAVFDIADRMLTCRYHAGAEFEAKDYAKKMGMAYPFLTLRVEPLYRAASPSPQGDQNG